MNNNNFYLPWEIFSFAVDTNIQAKHEILSIHISVENPSESEIGSFLLRLFLMYGAAMIPVDLVLQKLTPKEIRNQTWTWAMPEGTLPKRDGVPIADPVSYLTFQRIEFPNGSIMEPFGPDPTSVFETMPSYRKWN